MLCSSLEALYSYLSDVTPDSGARLLHHSYSRYSLDDAEVTSRENLVDRACLVRVVNNGDGAELLLMERRQKCCRRADPTYGGTYSQLYSLLDPYRRLPRSINTLSQRYNPVAQVTRKARESLNH